MYVHVDLAFYFAPNDSPGYMQIGLLSAKPGAPLIVGAIVSWNTIVMTMIPAYLVAHIKSGTVKLGVAGEGEGGA